MKKAKIILRTILIGILGGLIFNIFLFHLPLVLGLEFFVAVFALFETHVKIYQNLRNPSIGVISI